MNNLFEKPKTPDINELSLDTVTDSEISLNKSENQFDSLTSATIMMVDDEPINTDMVQMFLEQEGYKNFITTHESVQAFDLIVKNQPDVVLLDLIMPEVSGFEILTRVRGNEKLKYTPIIILTSSTDADTKLKALRLGANDFLSKPVDPSELVLRIRNTLAAKVYQDRLAYFDALTDLPNRQTFMNHLDWALHRAMREDLTGAILKLDLDRFKEINDTLGPNVGDVLLKEISQRLKECLRYSDTVGRFGQDLSQTSLCRIGGNEFAVLFPAIKQVEDITAIAQRILQAIVPACHPEHYELYITSSIGISIFPQDGDKTNTLIKHADVAMSHAKLQGGNRFQFYSDGLSSKSVERLKLANELRKAPERDELELFYQPKLNVKNGEIIGAEALMRWNHPQLGLVSPAIFIPLAEEAGLLPVLDDWGFQTACQQLIAWQASGVQAIPVSVNVTSQSFRRGRVIGTVRKALTKTGLDPQWIKLELTENTVMENAKENIELLNRLKDMGISLSIDDFGTGYSSLSYLNRFPIDELKIDRSFISVILEKPGNLAIVKAIIAMAHSLELNIVAEGIETKEQLVALQNLNCPEYQGFYFSKPVPSEAFLKLLK